MTENQKLAEALKPCPFCGSDALLQSSRDGEIYFVRCVKWAEGCMGASINSYNETDCTSQWNTRALSPLRDSSNEAYCDNEGKEGEAGESDKVVALDWMQKMEAYPAHKLYVPEPARRFFRSAISPTPSLEAAVKALEILDDKEDRIQLNGAVSFTIADVAVFRSVLEAINGKRAG